MGKTNIEWADKVWNPFTGCTKVSQGCANCYAERDFHRPYPDRNFTDVKFHEERLSHPLRWQKPCRIFVNSMSDLFHESIPFEQIAAVYGVMAHATRHTFQVLTKRPQRRIDFFDWLSVARGEAGNLPTDPLMGCEIQASRRGVQIKKTLLEEITWPLKNVWEGVSCEDQETADFRIPLLLQTPAAVRWVSAEPLLGPMTLDGSGYAFLTEFRRGTLNQHGAEILENRPRLDWVVAGGESGPNARPCHPDWIRSLRDQCQAAGVPFFFKQWGEWAPFVDNGPLPENCHYLCQDGRLLPGDAENDTDACVGRVGRSRSGRTLDNKEWSEYPS